MSLFSAEERDTYAGVRTVKASLITMRSLFTTGNLLVTGSYNHIVTIVYNGTKIQHVVQLTYELLNLYVYSIFEYKILKLFFF